MANRVYEWVDERTGIKPAVDYVLYRRIPKAVNWWFTFGSASLIVFIIQVVSGIFLAMGYVPSTAQVLRPDGTISNEALESIRHITTSVPFGDWMRGFHHWGANMMVIVVLIHTLRVFFMGSYKYPRELTWFIGVGILVMVLGFSFTGYLLPWDNRAYWATQVGVKIGGSAPLLGPAVESILKGGPALGAPTLSRFYALHVLLLPAITAGLIGLHLFLVIKIGISGQPPVKENTGGEYFDTSEIKKKKSGRAFFPYIIFKDAVVGLVVAGLIILATIFWPVENANPVNPTNPYSTLEGKSGGIIYETKSGEHVEAAVKPDGSPLTDAKGNQIYITDVGYGKQITVDQKELKQVQIPPQPEWYFLFLFQFLKLPPFQGEVNLGLFSISGEAIGGVIVPTILILVLLLAPILDRGPKRNPLNRPITSLIMLFILASMVVLTFLAISDLNAAVASTTNVSTPASTAPPASATTAAPPGGATTATAAPAGNGDAAAGAKTFRGVCQACHLNGGRNAGGVGPQLSNSPNAGDPAYIRNIVRNGKGAMAAIDKDTVSDAELENIVAYIASIRAK